jgi:predicted GNAT family acetyltransferase
VRQIESAPHPGDADVRDDGPGAPELEVRHNAAAHRFEAEVGGPGVNTQLAVANYHIVDGVMRIHHTEVPADLGGRGIASRIVHDALLYAESHGLKVEPWCSFVRSYMGRHPESQHLLPEGFRLPR